MGDGPWGNVRWTMGHWEMDHGARAHALETMERACIYIRSKIDRLRLIFCPMYL